MRDNPKPYELYRNLEGCVCQVVAVARRVETGEDFVVYRKLYDPNQVYAEPLSEFMGEADGRDYPGIKQRYRFAKIALESGEKAEEKTESARSAGETDVKREQAARSAGETDVKREQAARSAGETDVKREQAATPACGAAASRTPSAESVREEDSEEGTVNPALMRFLDAETYEEKLETLRSIKRAIDEDVIHAIAMSLDLEISEGSLEEQYEEVMNCLLTLEKYECSRLR